MIFNAIKFYQDFNIDHATSGNKHTRNGWVNINCPFCRGNDYHLGFHVSSGAYNCWRCGTKSQIDVVKTLTGVSWTQAKEILKLYQTDEVEGTKKRVLKKPSSFETVLPAGVIPWTPRHSKYLQNRNFDPEALIDMFDLKATGNLGRYKYRIIAPIYFNGRLVSYQGRDITNLSDLKYKACKQEDEAIEHQTILYNWDNSQDSESCLIVEGIADVWRMGKGAMSCFGTAFTLSQINLIARRYKLCHILFDADDENAVLMADQMSELLSARGLETEVWELGEKDPGDMPQDEADAFMRELNLKGWNK